MVIVDGVGGVLVAVVFVGGVYVLCWLLCCVVVNPHKSRTSFRFSMPQFALVILLLLLAGRSALVELRNPL